MPLSELNQSEWQELTTWHMPSPSYGSTWRLLTDPQLPQRFRNLAQSLSHPFLAKLQHEASPVLLPAASAEPVMDRRVWNNRFANLVSGRFTENLFWQAYAKRLETLGLHLTETTEKHDWLDYVITQTAEGFRLGINVKNAGIQFWSAADRLGLEPEDTLPIATYKIFGSTTKAEHVPLIYVYLVDWTLLSRLRAAYWAELSDVERSVFQLMTSFRQIPRKLEDCFIECTITDRLATLYTGVGYTEDTLANLPFRAISGLRCQRIFYINHDRAPYVYVQRMNTDPNVHVSVEKETVQFTDFVSRWLGSAESRVELLAGLARTEPFLIPNPPM